MLINNHILEKNVSHTQLIISPRLKHKIDKYVRYVNSVSVMLFSKSSSDWLAPNSIRQIQFQLVSMGPIIWQNIYHFLIPKNRNRLWFSLVSKYLHIKSGNSFLPLLLVDLVPIQ